MVCIFVVHRSGMTDIFVHLQIPATIWNRGPLEKESLGLPTDEFVAAYRSWGMFLDDLSIFRVRSV